MRIDWDDCRFFLAVIDHGSTKRAAQALKVDQTTCARRIASLEGSLGLELFRRDSGRYEPTADALALVEPARAMQAGAVALFETAGGRKRVNSRHILLTTDEALASQFVTAAVARLTSLHPDVEIELDASTDKRDLLAGEADLAVRGGLEPTEPGLVRRKLGDDPIACYCGWGYPSQPSTWNDLRDHPMACFPVVRERLEAAGLGTNIKQLVNSASALKAMVQDGGLIALMPRSIAEAEPPLKLCFTVPLPVAIWMIYPERLRGNPAIKALGKLLAEEFRRARKEKRVG